MGIIRFVVNFILFGFLFYLIFLYFPEAFSTLFSWVSQIWALIVKLFNMLAAKLNLTGTSTEHNPEPTHTALLLSALFHKLH